MKFFISKRKRKQKQFTYIIAANEMGSLNRDNGVVEENDTNTVLGKLKWWSCVAPQMAKVKKYIDSFIFVIDM